MTSESVTIALDGSRTLDDLANALDGRIRLELAKAAFLDKYAEMPPEIRKLIVTWSPAWTR